MSQERGPGQAPGDMRWEAAGKGGPRCLLARHGPARVAFTSRHAGATRGPYASLDLALHVGDDPEAVVRNREAVARVLGLTGAGWTCGEQVHGTDVAVVEAGNVGTGARTVSPIVADALVTAVPGALLAVLVADCVPVVAVDAQASAVGVAHAGWRGVLGGVLPGALEVMEGALGADAARTEVWIGPHIRSCCYQVDESRAALFAVAFGERAVVGGDRLDLEECLRMQLERHGVGSSRVHSVGLCTFCDQETFFSYRGAAGGITGRHAGLVAIGA